MERRKFLKASCTICLLAATGTLLPTMFSYAASGPKPFKTELNENSEVLVPTTLFADSNLQIVRVKHLDYDITLHKEDDGSFTALLMRCTHMDNELELTREGFSCSQHGSEFDKKGNVTKGPAEAPLTTYKTTIIADNIIISIPKEQK